MHDVDCPGNEGKLDVFVALDERHPVPWSSLLEYGLEPRSELVPGNLVLIDFQAPVLGHLHDDRPFVELRLLLQDVLKL